MPFTSSVTGVFDHTGKKLASGTYTSTGGSTGGDVGTGLDTVESFFLQPTGAAVATNAPSANETFPLTNVNGTVTIVTDADEAGLWLAVGQ